MNAGSENTQSTSGQADRLWDRSVRLLACSVLLMTLSACATQQGNPVPLTVDRAPETVQRHWIGSLDAVEEGQIIRLEKAVLNTPQRLQVHAQYQSASGRVCRRLTSVATSDYARVACRYDSSRWYLARSLAVQNDRYAPVQPDVSVETQAEGSVKHLPAPG